MKVTDAQIKMLNRLADIGGFIPGDDLHAKERAGRTWHVATKFALRDKGLIKINQMGTLYMSRDGYAVIGRENEF